ncbi:(2Fe-2S)-binding protein [uncultured Tateyamaria sp.]|uniref:(2Fe-2S)-binding protein n=1 Tax=uncultured Tateyamaria sp. TaxID=455651 RepID=UPI00260A4B12|nr:(2Fe-2S)-binding protein [uncultured Tateyamaria sp.]
MSTSFQLNGEQVTVDADPDMPLLWVVRERTGLTGTKFGCGIAVCGACTMHVDGVATRTCVLPLSAVDGAVVRTIEGIAPIDMPSAVQRAWLAHQVPQCGYCQSGMIMAVEALLDEIPDPTDADIDDAITNICRCGTYDRIRAAVHTAAALRREA